MNGRKKISKCARMLVAAMICMVISMIGASAVQSSGGRVKVKELNFETSMGYEMSALLLKPENADAEHKAPAVITCHGMYNTKEMQDSYFVELSRRGFVVLSIDMFSHGDSENLTAEDALPLGVSEALKMLIQLDYVDPERIGLTGHSMGGMNCNVAALMDNASETPRVAALLLNSCFATYTDEETGEYVNVYGSRDVGIIAGQYDEFLFQEPDADGNLMPPKDFIKSANAQSFLNFGREPQNVRQANRVYTEEMNGKEAMRVIYNPAVTHPWSHFSKRSAAVAIEFFDQSLKSPVQIDSGHQIWQWKEFFNLVGLAGFFLFALNFTLVMLRRPAFLVLRTQTQAEPALSGQEKKILDFILLAVNVVFGAVTYLPITILVRGDYNGKLLFAQNSTFGIGLWAAACGICALITCLIKKKLSGKGSWKDTGIWMSREKVLKTIALAVLTAAVTYLWVFGADYFFHTDFRIWVLAAKAFTAEKAGIILFPNVILFLVYYIFNSVLVNCCYYTEGKRERGQNLAVQAFTSVLPSLILVVMQYVHLRVTGKVLFAANNAHSFILWLFPILVLIPVSVIIARKIYMETKNPYLPGIINGILITIICCVNTSTWA